ncbi:MAG: tripartite tricarboxylate transporter substrate binding protein [Alphaproteobacteria bacterium]|nr:tripartite tricarboxylate transporter substrate binding protein [Alphaproteobacteria bacterium]
MPTVGAGSSKMVRVVLFALSILLLATGAGRAQYPDKPVRIIVPFIAGSAPDVAARQVAQRLTAGLGQQFIVDNKPGAAGNIGAELAARAAPDGYTLMLLTSSHVLNPFLYSRVGYDAVKDFAPITMITRIPSLMVVPPSSPAKTAAEFVALAKSMPGKLNYGSGGTGSLAHLSAEAFRLATGIDYVHVPYKGAPEIVMALLSDQVQVGFPTMPTAFRQAQQGVLRPLAVTSAKRTRAMPEVPTLLEAIPSGFALDAWLALAAPTGTPAEIVARLYATLTEALKDSSFRDALGSDGSEIVLNRPAEFAAILHDEVPKWRALIQRIGVKLE